MATFLLMLLLSGLALAVGVFSNNSLATSRSQLLDKQAYYIAEAGWQRARQALSAGTWSAASSTGNTYSESFGAGEYSVTIVDETTPAVEDDDTEYTITSSGYVPSAASYRSRRQVAETDVEVTVTNTNQSLSATATASSTNGSNTASKSKDGDTGTKWQAGTKGPNEWLKMDYGSAATVNRMIIKDDGNISSAITIQHSDDAAAWTAVSGSSIVESPNNTFDINFTSTSHRYFRALFPDVGSGSRAGVKEMETYNIASRAVEFGDAGTVTSQW
ncbi:MAG: discoidin domain-containing protein [Candidatus Omnitrophica bacterium]|nr:discoidin domain-containing protein [Candidatus Omnitrophota bacterium]